MIRVSITRADATVTETETLTAGRVGLECAFTFSGEWEGLQKVAVFEGAETIEVALGTATVAVVPPECMATAGYNLRVGAYGLSAEEALVIPTVWAKAGKIKDSASPDESSYNYTTPELAAQIMETAENAKNIAQAVAQAAENGDFNGADGVSPSATVTKSGDTATITITDADGTTTASVLDGTDGSAGYSPEVEIESITGGHSVTITDAEHPTGQTFNVMDGDESIKWATYGTTTSAQLESWYQAGYQICCEYNGRTYSMAYRTSATKHTLSVIYGNSCFALVCDSDSWSATTYALAQAANVPAKATSTPSDLGTAAIGSSSKYAAEDHVHKMPSASDVGAVAVAQGVGHAGEFCVVGSDGNITTATMTAWSGGNY
ncbi:MAG: hypothetical protein J6Y20_03620 [Lachnospiraceae bacterium]|nr:hypothetical protein [Lachnospiraceae bacterium]